MQSSDGWVDAVRILQFRNPIYATLNESNLRFWYTKEKLPTEYLAKRIAGFPKSKPTGRRSVLFAHPAELALIKARLTALSKAGNPMNSTVCISVMKAILANKPRVIQQLKMTPRFARHFLHREMRWTFHRTTTAACKLPKCWPQHVEKFCQRAALTIYQHKIAHPSLIINWDQTGIMLMPSPNYTYTEQGSKDAAVIGMEDKRQITAVVASTLSKELLPLQLCFKGKDESKSKRGVPNLRRTPLGVQIEQHGWHLTQTHNHWSNQFSMRDYINKIIVPWIDAKKRQHNCPKSHSLCIIDCWKVHISAEFRTWMTKNHPTIHLVFVPANCTAKAQPADVAHSVH